MIKNGLFNKDKEEKPTSEILKDSRKFQSSHMDTDWREGGGGEDISREEVINSMEYDRAMIATPLQPASDTPASFFLVEHQQQQQLLMTSTTAVNKPHKSHKHKSKHHLDDMTKNNSTRRTNLNSNSSSSSSSDLKDKRRHFYIPSKNAYSLSINILK